VSRAGIVYVVGDVQHPSGFLMEDSAISAFSRRLALAGGSTRTSALEQDQNPAADADGVQEIPVDLKKVLYAKAPDVAMVKGDVLFIPGSARQGCGLSHGGRSDVAIHRAWRWLRLILRVSRALRHSRALGARRCSLVRGFFAGELVDDVLRARWFPFAACARILPPNQGSPSRGLDCSRVRRKRQRGQSSTIWRACPSTATITGRSHAMYSSKLGGNHSLEQFALSSA
jgi:hypothetical protein